MSFILISAISNSIMTPSTPNRIMTRCFEIVVTFTSQVYPIIGLIVWGISSTTSNRCCRIRRMYSYQSIVICMAALTGVSFNLSAASTSRNLIIGTPNPRD
ncbi:MAG: hypothetical protein JRI61_10170 [Deltaproteobacteria bacterium]|nr:hypothetical protein [Deltaproteobacteria bacterium]